MSFTFHRAFDVVSKPKEALLQLIALGVRSFINLWARRKS